MIQDYPKFAGMVEESSSSPLGARYGVLMLCRPSPGANGLKRPAPGANGLKRPSPGAIEKWFEEARARGLYKWFEEAHARGEQMV